MVRGAVRAVRGAWMARAVLGVQVVREVLGVQVVREVLGGWDATVGRAAVLASVGVQEVRVAARGALGVLAPAGVQRGRAAEARAVLGARMVRAASLVVLVVAGVQAARSAPLPGAPMPGAAGADRSADSPLGGKGVRSLNGCVRGV